MAEKPRNPSESSVKPGQPPATGTLLPGFAPPKDLRSETAGELLARLGMMSMPPPPPTLMERVNAAGKTLLNIVRDPPPPAHPAPATIGPTPESTLADRLISARMMSHNPLQYLDKVTDATLGHYSREGFRYLRSLLPDIGDRSMVIDGGSQLVGGLAYFASFDFPLPGGRDARPGDQQIGARVEATLQRYLERTARPDVKGVDDVVMASGWKFTSGEILVNGKIVRPTLEQPLEIKNMLAVFVRTRQEGKPDKIEILDPSTKIEGFSWQFPEQLLNAITAPEVHRAYLKGMKPGDPVTQKYAKMIEGYESDTDRRWREVAGATGYIGWQILPAIVSGGALGASKGVVQTATKLPGLVEKGTHFARGAALVSAAAESTSALPAAQAVVTAGAVKASQILTQIAPKVPAIAEGAAKVSLAAQGVSVLAAPLGVGNTAGGMGAMGGQFSQSLYFSPEAIKKLADSISSVVTDPKLITAQGVRDKLNSGLYDKSFKEGSNASQYYIPSLRSGDSPWQRLQEALSGSVNLYEKRNNPWEKWPAGQRRVEVLEIKEALAADPKIAYAFYSAVQKHLSGKTPTDQEIFVMRVGYKISKEGTENLSPAGKDSTETTLRFSPEERAETLKLIDGQLQNRLRDKIAPLLTGIKLDKMGPDGITLDPKVSARILTETGVSLKKIDLDFILDPKFTPAQIKAFVNHEVVPHELAREKERQADLVRAQQMASMALAPL